MMTSLHIHPALQAGQNHTPNHGSGASVSCASIGLFLGLVPREMEAVLQHVMRVQEHSRS